MSDNPVRVGEEAPDFDLQGYSGGELKGFKLSDYRGQWVYLLFYPLDFTFVWPSEILAFARAAKDFEAKNCQILGISVDSQFTHKAWAETSKEEGGLGGELTYPLLADLNKTVCQQYGVLLGGGVSLRGLFLIDPNGVIMQATINNLPVGRSTAEAMRLLDGFQFVASHDGQVCPANWTTGADTMGASVDGMRKYITSH